MKIPVNTFIIDKYYMEDFVNILLDSDYLVKIAKNSENNKIIINVFKDTD